MALFSRGKAAPAGADALVPIPRTPAGEIDLEGGVIEVGGRKHAASLNWMETNGGSPREMREAARSGDMHERDLYVIPAGLRAIGFGSTDQGHRKDMPPLAVSLNPAFVGARWTGAFFVGTIEQPAFWLCQVQNGVVVDDVVIIGMTEAMKAFRQLMSTHAGGMIFCPDEWGEPDSIAVNLWDVVLRRPRARLRKFGFVRQNLLLLVMGGILVTVMGGSYYVWSSQQAWQLQLAEQERLRRERRIQILDTDYPWFGAPHPSGFMDACMTAFGRLARDLPGWQQEPMTCALRIPDVPTGPRPVGEDAPPRPPAAVGTTDTPPTVLVTAQWARDRNGKIAWLRESFQPSPGLVSLDGTGNTASVTEEIALEMREGYFERPALAVSRVRTAFLEKFQNLGIEAGFSEIVSTQQPVDNPLFDYTDVAWQDRADPRALLPLIDDVPALIPVDMVWEPATGLWTVAVRVYHEAKLPAGAF